MSTRRANIALGLIFAFLVNTFGPLPSAQAQDFRLPAPGAMVPLSPEFNPPILKGIKVHPDNPFRFDFILDRGDSQLSNEALKDESSKLIRYFLASLTIPEKDLWVNLSPYEKDRIIPNSFGLTEMGRDLLAEDYMLKQITASLIYPEGEPGKRFWKRIYEVAEKKFGTTNIPVNTFNKVWIVPSKAVVYENAKAGTAYVVESKLKVMLEQDYLSLEKHEGILSTTVQVKDTNQLGSEIVREIVIPELTKEINEDKNFFQLRQVYNSLILATWYKKKIKDSILEQVYANKNKVAGVNIDDPQEKEKIYQRYLQAFKRGAYNYIKEEIDPATQQVVPRKYFSGGMGFSDYAMNTALGIYSMPGRFSPSETDLAQVTVNLDRAMVGKEGRKDAAMNGDSNGSGIQEQATRRTWWKRLVGSIKNDQEAMRLGSINAEGVKMTLRRFLALVTAAAVNSQATGVGSLFHGTQGGVITVSQQNFTDLFFSGLSADRIKRMEAFYNGLDVVERFHDTDKTIQGWDMYIPSLLADAVEYSKRDPFFNFLPTQKELKILLDFFRSDPIGPNFLRFSENPGIQACARGNVKLTSLIRRRELSTEEKVIIFHKSIRKYFNNDVPWQIERTYETTIKFPSLVKHLKQDPYLSRFAGIFQKYFTEGVEAIKSDPILLDYIERYWKPIQNIEDSLEGPERILRLITEQKRLGAIWEAEQEEWARKYREQQQKSSNIGKAAATARRITSISPEGDMREVVSGQLMTDQAVDDYLKNSLNNNRIEDRERAGGDAAMIGIVQAVRKYLSLRQTVRLFRSKLFEHELVYPLKDGRELPLVLSDRFSLLPMGKHVYIGVNVFDIYRFRIMTKKIKEGLKIFPELKSLYNFTPFDMFSPPRGTLGQIAVIFSYGQNGRPRLLIFTNQQSRGLASRNIKTRDRRKYLRWIEYVHDRIIKTAREVGVEDIYAVTDEEIKSYRDKSRQHFGTDDVGLTDENINFNYRLPYVNKPDRWQLVSMPDFYPDGQKPRKVWKYVGNTSGITQDVAKAAMTAGDRPMNTDISRRGVLQLIAAWAASESRLIKAASQLSQSGEASVNSARFVPKKVSSLDRLLQHHFSKRNYTNRDLAGKIIHFAELPVSLEHDFPASLAILWEYAQDYPWFFDLKFSRENMEAMLDFFHVANVDDNQSILIEPNFKIFSENPEIVRLIEEEMLVDGLKGTAQEAGERISRTVVFYRKWRNAAKELNNTFKEAEEINSFPALSRYAPIARKFLKQQSLKGLKNDAQFQDYLKRFWYPLREIRRQERIYPSDKYPEKNEGFLRAIFELRHQWALENLPPERHGEVNRLYRKLMDRNEQEWGTNRWRRTRNAENIGRGQPGERKSIEQKRTVGQAAAVPRRITYISPQGEMREVVSGQMMTDPAVDDFLRKSLNDNKTEDQTMAGGAAAMITGMETDKAMFALDERGVSILKNTQVTVNGEPYTLYDIHILNYVDMGSVEDFKKLYHADDSKDFDLKEIKGPILLVCLKDLANKGTNVLDAKYVKLIKLYLGREKDGYYETNEPKAFINEVGEVSLESFTFILHSLDRLSIIDPVLFRKAVRFFDSNEEANEEAYVRGEYKFEDLQLFQSLCGTEKDEDTIKKILDLIVRVRFRTSEKGAEHLMKLSEYNLFFKGLEDRLGRAENKTIEDEIADQLMVINGTKKYTLISKIEGRPLEVKFDAAMRVNAPSKIAQSGGIDLTSDKALSVQNNGQGIKFHLDPAQLAQLQNAPGFVPVIINIQPMTDIKAFLGLNDNKPAEIARL